MKHSEAYKKRKKGALKNTSNKKILKTTEVSKDTFKLFVFNVPNSAEIEVKAQNIQKKQRNISKTYLSEITLRNIQAKKKEKKYKWKSDELTNSTRTKNLKPTLKMKQRNG